MSDTNNAATYGDSSGQSMVRNSQMPKAARAAVAADRNKIENKRASPSHTPA